MLTSVDAVKLYLAQISKHSHEKLHLNAIISVAERDFLLTRTRELDSERSQGKVRGPFHSVPIILKDLCNIANMLTTRGSYAFKQGRPKKDSNLIHTLKAAGLIILAKENPSKLSNLKGWHQMAGWSAVGGQGPVGSSSGSAVSVAAGFAPVSLSTEFDGSIVMPAARAGLYAIKLFLKASTMTDSILEQLADAATLSAILQLHDPAHYHPLAKSWSGLKVGFVDPSLWRSYSWAIYSVDCLFNQTDNALFSAQAKIEEAGGKVTRSVPVASWDDITGAMPNFSQEEELFLFNGVPQTLEELIKFNEDLADLEFTKRDNHQKGAGSRA